MRHPQQEPMIIMGVRVPRELRAKANRVAADRGETVSEVVRRALERYVRDHPLPPDDVDG